MATQTMFSTLSIPTNSISVFREDAAYDVERSITHSAIPYLRPARSDQVSWSSPDSFLSATHDSDSSSAQQFWW